MEVRPFDASVVWTGAKPTHVQPSWITCTPVVDDEVKTEIAKALTIQNLDNYNFGNHTYKLQKLHNSVEVNSTTYNLMVSGSYSAELTIEKNTAEVQFVNGTTPLAYVAGDLTYTGQDQALLTGSMSATIGVDGPSVPVIFTLDPEATTPVTFTDAASVVARNAGTYKVYYKVEGNDNYDGSDWTLLATSKSIAKATDAEFNVAAVTGLVFDNTDQALLAKTVADAPIVPFGAANLQYQIDGGEWTAFTTLDAITGKSAKNAVAYAVKLRITADANWENIESPAINVTIAKATPIFTYVPTHENGGLPSGLVYDGQPHQLVLQQATAIVENTEISVPLKYSLRRYRNVTGNYTTRTSKQFDQLVGTLASTRYQIRAYNEATDDLNQVIQELENVVIDKATIPAKAYTEPVAKNVRTTGAAQDLVDAATWTGETTYGTFQYSLNGTDWSTDIPKGTDVAEYPVYWRILPTVVSDTRNYNIVSGNKTSIITAKSKVTVTTVANQSFGYGTTPTIKKNVAWEEPGEDALNEAGLTWKFYAEGDAECTGAEVEKVNGYYPVGTYNVIASGLAVTGETAASQEIVYVPALVNITAGQVNATISGTATYGSLPVFTLTHTSGLSPAEAANFNADNISMVTVKKGTDVLAENVAKNADVLKTLAAGEYDLEATATIAGGNYAVFVTAGKLTVSANDAFNFSAVIEDIAAVEYKAAKWEPEVTVTGFTAGKDYTVSYGDDTHDNVKAGEGIVKIAGIGNYAGATGSKTFTINKANLTITADNFTDEKAWQYGTTEPTYTITATGWLESGDALAVGSTVAGIEGTLQVKRTSNTSVGLHTGALVPYFKDADGNEIATPVATNYALTLTPGNLQVAKAALAIKLKEAVVGTYGDDPAANITAGVINNIANYELDNCELPGANLADVVNVAGVAYVLGAIDNNKYLVGTDYEFTLTGATSTNYTVTISNGTYKVDPAAITLYAKNQFINWADEDNTNDEANTTVSDATVAIAKGALKCGDALTDVIASINIAGTKVGNNNITLTAATTNANYNITVNKDADGNDKIGNLEVTGGATITLTRVAKGKIDNATVAQLIKDYDQKNVNVTIKFNDPGYNTLKPNKWYAFILPFKTDVKMISDAFGYAIVDLLNEGNTNSHRTVFSLKMDNAEIPANTPFIVKVWKTIDMENDGVTFDDVKIEAPETYDEIAVGDAAGNQFIGSYTGINGLGAYKPEYSGHVLWWSLNQASENDNDARPASDTGYLRQMSAFSYVPDDVAAHEFIIEELGGNTTVIRGINIDGQNISAEGLYNMNGMKLNSVPTQKGVYIQNGKKIVIK